MLRLNLHLKHFAWIAVCLLLSSVAGAADPTSESVAEMSRLEEQWNRAHLEGDAQTLDRLWADDLIIVVPGMAPLTKEDALQLWRSARVTISRYETSDLKIRVYGDAAVVSGRLHRSRNFAGRQAEDSWLFTKSYALVAGRWQVVAYHASTAPELRKP
jgi:ketosteroid isomerase-like protein